MIDWIRLRLWRAGPGTARLFLAATALLVGNPVVALPVTPGIWKEVYPDSMSIYYAEQSGSACTLCHLQTSGPAPARTQLNAYGESIRREFKKFTAPPNAYPNLTVEQRKQAIRGVETLNSDVSMALAGRFDPASTTNLDEILKHTQPGWNARPMASKIFEYYQDRAANPNENSTERPSITAPAGLAPTIDPTAARVTLLAGAQQIAASGPNGCAVKDGAVHCWGGRWGATFNDVGFPLQVAARKANLPAASMVAVGGRHHCAITATGGVKCWGRNCDGQLGNGQFGGCQTPIEEPVDAVGLSSGVVAIALGEDHSCAVTSAGGVKCWGYNSQGQLGDGSITTSNVPVDVRGLASGVVAVAAGYSHTCALTSGGGVKCWGDNLSGQVGGVVYYPPISRWLAPTDVIGLTNGVAAIATGDNHSCALTTAGGMKCWGENYYGQLGNGGTVSSPTAIDVPTLTSGVSGVAATHAQTCALIGSGGVKCWGRAPVGNGTASDSLVPADVSGLLTGATSVAGTCARLTSGRVKCWGGPYIGGIHAAPVDVAEHLDRITLAGGAAHTCSLGKGGNLSCWGANDRGQLGDATTIDRRRAAKVSGATDVIAVASGERHSCALERSGAVRCWGGNDLGQLGDGTAQDRRAPAVVSGLGSGVTAIGAGSFHACALTTGGAVKCWGWNVAGQLGDGTTANRSAPVDVVGLGADVTAIAVGDYHNCALTSAGAVKCWGFNSNGQLGNNSTADASVPVTVSTLPYVTGIASGGYHSCATSAGTAWCWGWNASGQLGTNSTVDSLVPALVSGQPSFIEMTAGVWHTCGLTYRGALKCWGNSFYGQVGTGTQGEWQTPVDVAGLGGGVQAIAAGDRHTCAVTSPGGVMCWGGNANGGLGDGTTSDRLGPVDVLELADTLTSLSSSTNPANAGQSITLTAVVNGNSPTGSVEFSDGTVPIAGCSAVPLASGAGNTRSAVCIITYDALAAGVHPIAATYLGDGGNGASTSQTLQQRIVAPSTTSLSSSANPSALGASVTFAADVNGIAPTGTVAFRNGATPIPGCEAVALTGTGFTRTATCATTGLGAGTHPISAVYSGDSGNAPSTSPVLVQTVVGSYQLTVTAGTGGRVDRSPGQASYPAGTVVTLTAVADAGYGFGYWTGDASGNANPVQITMNGNRSVGAVFQTTGTCGGFADVAGASPFCANVEWLRNRGVTLGCSSTTTYCPNDGVSRVAMAAFLNRLGTALLGPALSAQLRSGAFDATAGPVVCQTGELEAKAYPRRAHLDSVLSALASLATEIEVVPAVSLDNGATWSGVGAGERQSLAANRWGNVRGLGHVDLNAGQVAHFGLMVVRSGGSGAAPIVDSWCHLRARIENRSSESPPLDR